MSTCKLLDIGELCWFFIHFVCRISLIKGKTARQDLQEKGLWEEYRKQNPYNPMVKFIQSGTQSMTNDADVRKSRFDSFHYDWRTPTRLCYIVHTLQAVYIAYWLYFHGHVSSLFHLVVLLWCDLHRNPSSVLQRHLWHGLLQPVDPLSLLLQPGLWWVPLRLQLQPRLLFK